MTENYPDYLFEEAAKREAENKAFEALDNLYKENGDALKRLAEIECNEVIVAKVSEEDYEKVMDAAERQELARNENTKISKMKLIDRYNQFYNDECSGLSHGTPISMEHLQAITLECAVKAFARKYNLKDSIPVEDLLYLAKELMKQSERTVEKVSAEQ